MARQPFLSFQRDSNDLHSHIHCPSLLPIRPIPYDSARDSPLTLISADPHGISVFSTPQAAFLLFPSEGAFWPPSSAWEDPPELSRTTLLAILPADLPSPPDNLCPPARPVGPVSAHCVLVCGVLRGSHTETHYFRLPFKRMSICIPGGLSVIEVWEVWPLCRTAQGLEAGHLLARPAAPSHAALRPGPLTCSSQRL